MPAQIPYVMHRSSHALRALHVLQAINANAARPDRLGLDSLSVNVGGSTLTNSVAEVRCVQDQTSHFATYCRICKHTRQCCSQDSVRTWPALEVVLLLSIPHKLLMSVLLPALRCYPAPHHCAGLCHPTL